MDAIRAGLPPVRRRWTDLAGREARRRRVLAEPGDGPGTRRRRSAYGGGQVGDRGSGPRAVQRRRAGGVSSPSPPTNPAPAADAVRMEADKRGLRARAPGPALPSTCAVGGAGLDPAVHRADAAGQLFARPPAQAPATRPTDSELRSNSPARADTARVGRAPGYLADDPDEVQHADLDPGADVPAPRLPGLGGGQEGAHRVADVYVVPGLGAIPVNGRSCPARTAQQKIGIPRVAAGVLARPDTWPAASPSAGSDTAGCTTRCTARRSTWRCPSGTQATAVRPPATGSPHSARTGYHPKLVSTRAPAAPGRLQHIDRAVHVDMGVVRWLGH